MVKATPSWKGAPLWEDKDDGWSFKPRGRIQYDAGCVSNPRRQQSITRNLGFNTRARRIRLGAEGTIPGGFGYKFEMDFANCHGRLRRRHPDLCAARASRGTVAIGNHETNNGLEQHHQLALHLVHRARRVRRRLHQHPPHRHQSAAIVNKAGDFRFNAGLFAAHSIDASVDNEGWIAAARAVYSPLMGGNQLHFGANFQHRKFQANNGGTPSTSIGAPSTNQLARYRARPFTPDDRRPLRRHRQFRGQERQYPRPRIRRASSSRCTSPPKASI